MEKGWKVGVNTSRGSEGSSQALGSHGGRARRLGGRGIEFEEDRAWAWKGMEETL